jgi:excinuclease ABC subunit A
MTACCARLFHLRDIGNTVIVVEHDEDAIRHADHIIDIGPGAGVHGGENRRPGQSCRGHRRLRGVHHRRYLSGRLQIACLHGASRPPKKMLRVLLEPVATICAASMSPFRWAC